MNHQEKINVALMMLRSICSARDKPNSDTKSLVTQAGGGFISAHEDKKQA